MFYSEPSKEKMVERLVTIKKQMHCGDQVISLKKYKLPMLKIRPNELQR